jgi:cytochrome c
MRCPVSVIVALALLVATPAFANGPALANANADRGRELYESRCFGCHSLDASRIGPKHRGVYGRKAGSVEEFMYSAAVRNSNVVWSDDTLLRWLTNPQEVIPGQRMNFRVSQPQDRADIVAYLKRESGR